jgi:hypothetical protein
MSRACGITWPTAHPVTRVSWNCVKPSAIRRPESLARGKLRLENREGIGGYVCTVANSLAYNPHDDKNLEGLPQRRPIYSEPGSQFALRFHPVSGDQLPS